MDVSITPELVGAHRHRQRVGPRNRSARSSPVAGTIAETAPSREVLVKTLTSTGQRASIFRLLGRLSLVEIPRNPKAAKTDFHGSAGVRIDLARANLYDATFAPRSTTLRKSSDAAPFKPTCRSYSLQATCRRTLPTPEQQLRALPNRAVSSARRVCRRPRNPARCPAWCPATRCRPSRRACCPIHR